MRRKWTVLALAGLLLTLCGCSLARAEAEGAGGAFGDRLAGVYLYRWDSTSAANQGFHGNPNLTEYGSSTVELEGYGSFALPDQVLFAREVDNTYVFPGLEGGYSLFVLEKQEEYGEVTEMVGSMAPGKEGCATKVTDGTREQTLSGVVYFGPPLGQEEGWEANDAGTVWQAFRVYQTEDGRPYLDGGGNMYLGGGSFGFTISDERTVTENGEASTERTEVSVQVEEAQRLEKLAVTQFDEENGVLRRDELDLGEDLPEIRCEAGAAWVLVEEAGPEETVRTAYNVPREGEEPIAHGLVLLDGEGLGHLEDLFIGGNS